jgi:hypothetical protein
MPDTPKAPEPIESQRKPLAFSASNLNLTASTQPTNQGFTLVLAFLASSAALAAGQLFLER